AGCSCAGPYGHSLLGIDEETSTCFLRAIEAGYEGVKPGWARVSFHFLLDDEERDFLLDVIEFIAESGHLFLPLYTFEWRTGAWRYLNEAEVVRPAAFDSDEWHAVERSSRTRGEDHASYLAEADRLAGSLREQGAIR